MTRRLAAALAVSLLPLTFATSEAQAAPGGPPVIVRHKRVCYTANGVRRCHVTTIHVVRVRGTWGTR